MPASLMRIVSSRSLRPMELLFGMTRGFDIPAGETVRFIQPSVDATVINEIIQQTPSKIDGNIFANGKVVLLNSSGIVFGKDSVVEVGKLHAIAGSNENISL